MRKIVYTCDRCGAEIDGGAGVFRIEMRDQQGGITVPDLDEVSQLFSDPEEQKTVYTALDPGWDLCAECIADVLRTLIGAMRGPRAIVKTENIPDAPRPTRGRKIQSKDADVMEDKRTARIEKKRRVEK